MGSPFSGRRCDSQFLISKSRTSPISSVHGAGFIRLASVAIVCSVDSRTSPTSLSLSVTRIPFDARWRICWRTKSSSSVPRVASTYSNASPTGRIVRPARWAPCRRDPPSPDAMIANSASGKSMPSSPTLDDHQHVALAASELVEELLPGGRGISPLMNGTSSASEMASPWSRYSTKTSALRCRVFLQQESDLVYLRRVVRSSLSPPVADGGDVLVGLRVVAPGDESDVDLWLLDEAGLEQRRPVRADGRADECEYLLLVVGLPGRSRSQSQPVFACRSALRR